MNRRRWLVGAGCLAGALFAEWRATAQQASQQMGVHTLDYWVAMATILGRDDFYSSVHTFNQTHAERADSEAREIERLPREGVDPALLAFADRLLAARKKLAPMHDARWYHGVFWRTPKPVLDARKEAEALKADLAKLRADLAKKYQCAFPECPFPSW
jgi:hypothetical protein